MPRRPTNPLAAASRLLVDGTNLLHALHRDGEPLAAPAVVGRLRALVPAGVAVVVVLDGSPAPGEPSRRVVSGVEVHHAGRRPADDLLRQLAAARSSGTLVVTDDGALGADLRAIGASTAGTAWLAGRLARQRLGAPAAGRPAAPPTPASPRAGWDAGPDAEPDRPAWRPGRGATAKRGNPRRGHPRR